MPRNKPEAGNAFIFVLIAIVLFAALAMTFSRGSRQGIGNISSQQAKVAAGEMLNYARMIESAVDRVRQNGCSESEINFDNAVVAGYFNPDAPVDGSCDIFETTGGRAIWADPPTGANDGTAWLINGRNAIHSVPKNVTCNTGDTDCSELVLLLTGVNKQVCLEINDWAEVTNPSGDPPQEFDDIEMTKFEGTLIQGDEIRAVGYTEGKYAACVEGNGTPPADSYAFYYVLLAR